VITSAGAPAEALRKAARRAASSPGVLASFKPATYAILGWRRLKLSITAKYPPCNHSRPAAGCINVIDFNDANYAIIRMSNYTPYNPLKSGLELTTMERYFLEFAPRDE
jgi:hypothetical protein